MQKSFDEVSEEKWEEREEREEREADMNGEEEGKVKMIEMGVSRDMAVDDEEEDEEEDERVFDEVS